MIPDGTLADTRPLFALVDPKNQPEQFQRCTASALALPVPLVTTWPCFSEAIYLAGRTDRWRMQQLIAELVSVGTLRLHTPSESETARALELMRLYQDQPMDLADASLIALAETAGYTRIFSIDSDFYVYRLADGTSLEVMPGPLKKTPVNHALKHTATRRGRHKTPLRGVKTQNNSVLSAAPFRSALRGTRPRAGRAY